MVTASTTSNKDRADNYRLMAAGLHALASLAKSGEAQVELIRLAMRYELLSQRLEFESGECAEQKRA